MISPSPSDAYTGWNSDEEEVGSAAERRRIARKLRRIIVPFVERNFDRDVKMGIPLSDDTIEMALRYLAVDTGKISLDDFPTEYKVFLNNYGSVRGPHHEVCGSRRVATRNESDAEYLAALQRNYENLYDLKDETGFRVKSYWFIAKVQMGCEYLHFYLDLSIEKNGRVYSSDPRGNHRLYAKDFFEFLTKFFSSFERFHEQQDIEIPDDDDFPPHGDLAWPECDELREYERIAWFEGLSPIVSDSEPELPESSSSEDEDFEIDVVN